MRKLALAGLFSILATISLSGCNQAPVEETQIPADDTTPVVQEEETVVQTPQYYVNNEIGIQFYYPGDMNLKTIQEGEEGPFLATIGDDEISILVEAQRKDYEGGISEIAPKPYGFLKNLCVEDDFSKDSLRDCNTDGNITTYYALEKGTYTTLSKYAYIEDNSKEWDKVRFSVTLIDSKSETVSEDSINAPLTEMQLEKVKVIDSIVKTFDFTSDVDGGGGIAATE